MSNLPKRHQFLTKSRLSFLLTRCDACDKNPYVVQVAWFVFFSADVPSAFSDPHIYPFKPTKTSLRLLLYKLRNVFAFPRNSNLPVTTAPSSPISRCDPCMNQMDLQGADIAGCQVLLHVQLWGAPDTGTASSFHGSYCNKLLPLYASGLYQCGWLEEWIFYWKIVCLSSMNAEDTRFFSVTTVCIMTSNPRWQWNKQAEILFYGFNHKCRDRCRRDAAKT